jgi:hypothetical protein
MILDFGKSQIWFWKKWPFLKKCDGILVFLYIVILLYFLYIFKKINDRKIKCDGDGDGIEKKTQFQKLFLKFPILKKKKLKTFQKYRK